MKFVSTILFQYNGNNLRVFINVYIWVIQLLSLEEKLLQENIRNFWFSSRALTRILFWSVGLVCCREVFFGLEWIIHEQKIEKYEHAPNLMATEKQYN